MSKLSIGRKTPSIKSSSWVEPSFGDLFGSSDLGFLRSEKGVNSGDPKSKAQWSTTDSSGRRPQKRKAAAHKSERRDPLSTDLLQQSQDDPWVEKHSPRTQVDLAVHKKKIEEVENWLKRQMGDGLDKKGGAILLLTGPSGCGKTATLQVLTQELGCQIQEWSNPSTVNEFKTDEPRSQAFDPESRFHSFSSRSQTAEFQEFLLRANKYNCLKMLGDSVASDKKLILIEDLPNQFYRQPACLHEVLRRFVRTGRCPLVFIISDSLSGDSNSRLLFPREVQEELGVCNISFNPVAHTGMMKVLNKVVTQEASKSGGRILVPDKAALELLCLGSSGDIRSAINSLQFSSLTGHSVKSKLWVKTGKPASSSSRHVSKGRQRGVSTKGSSQEGVTQAIGGKDASLFLFRALGKVLYCKREGCEALEQLKLPVHLAEHHRDALLVDPEIVVEKSHMSPELFNLYLQQNYLDFFLDVEDVARASEYLSDADFLTVDWASRSTMREYSSSVATRGLIHSNSARARADSQAPMGFRPLHKPHWLFVNKKHRENCLSSQSLFVNFCLTPVSLQTELLPYLAQLSNPMRNQAQIAFIEDVGRLPRERFTGRLKFEALTDKEPGMLDLGSDDEDPAVPGPVDPTNSSKDLSSSQEPGADVVDLPASQPQPTTAQALLEEEEEEETVIEEYASD